MVTKQIHIDKDDGKPYCGSKQNQNGWSYPSVGPALEAIESGSTCQPCKGCLRALKVVIDFGLYMKRRAK